MNLLQFATTYPIFTAVFILACVIWTVGTIKDFSKPADWKDTDWRRK